MDIDHPGLNLTRNMMAASQLAGTLREWLTERKVKRIHEYRIMVDYAMMPDELSTYAYCLRIYRVGPSKIPILTKWSETRYGLMSDENLALLLVLYNS